MFTNSVNLLAQTTEDPRMTWLPVVLLIVIAIGFAVTNLVASIIIGPKKTGPGKEQAYESGMVPFGDARRRFNVRFYLVAMIFLVFDVEIVFFYPWAALFPEAVAQYNLDAWSAALSIRLLVSMLIFVAILLVAYFYAWGKGVFRWD